MDVKNKGRDVSPPRSRRQSDKSATSNESAQNVLPRLNSSDSVGRAVQPFAGALQAFRRATSKLSEALQTPNASTSKGVSQTALTNAKEQEKAEILKIFTKQLAVATESQANGQFRTAHELVTDFVDAVSSGRIDRDDAIQLLMKERFTQRTILLGDLKTYDQLVKARLAMTKPDNFGEVIAMVAQRRTMAPEFVGGQIRAVLVGKGKASFFSLPQSQQGLVRAVLDTNDVAFCVEVFASAAVAVDHALSAGKPDLAAQIIRQNYQGIDPSPESDLPSHLVAPPAYESI